MSEQQNQSLALSPIQRTNNVLIKQAPKIERWCTSGVKTEALIRWTLHTLENDDKLIQCTPMSVYLAVLACAAVGLVPGPLKGEVFLVPRNRNTAPKGKPDQWVTEATFMMGYKGYERMAERGGMVIESGEVCENDTFKYDEGTDSFITHSKAMRERGAVIAAYAWTVKPHQTRKTIELVPLEDLRKMEAAGGGRSAAWKTWFGQMARKGAVKRLGKHLPWGDDWRRGEALDDADDGAGSLVSTLDMLRPDGVPLLSSELASETASGLVFTEAPVKERPPLVVTAQGLERAGKTGTKPASGNKPIDAASTERPTAPPASAGAGSDRGGSAASSSSATPGLRPATDKATPTNPILGTSTGGSTGQPGSTTTPAASSPTSSTAAQPTPTVSTSSESPAPTDPASSNGADGNDLMPEYGDVASEPAIDDRFDASFGEDPVDEVPPRPAEKSVAAFKQWCLTCHTKADLKAGMEEWKVWAGKTFKAGRRADPSKGIEEIAGDPETVEMQRAYAQRYKEIS